MTTKEEIALLEDALIAWRSKQTRQRGAVSLQAFADVLGVSRSLMSMWMNGDRHIADAQRDRIAAPLAYLVGFRAFDVLGVPAPDYDLYQLERIWEYLPPPLRKSLREEGEKYVAQFVGEPDRRLSEDTP